MTTPKKGRRGLWLPIFFLTVLCIWPADHLCAEEAKAAFQYIEKAREALRKGDFPSAISEATKATKTVETEKGASSRAEAFEIIALAYLALGQYNRVQQELIEALALIPPGDERGRQRRPLLALLGYARFQQGDVKEAEKLLRKVREEGALGKDLHTTAMANAYLGDIAGRAGDYEKAIRFYEEGQTLAAQAGDLGRAASIAVDRASLALKKEKAKEAGEQILWAIEKLKSSGDSYQKSFTCVRAGIICKKLAVVLLQDKDRWIARAQGAFAQAMDGSQNIGDRRTLSYASGYLGQLYEDQNRLEDALGLTHKALFAARQIGARESAYLWEWQTGRLLRAQGHTKEATTAYKQALVTLQALRKEALGCPGPAHHTTYRSTVEPIFMEFTDFLLKQAGSARSEKEVSEYLFEARRVVEVLKTVELEDYFQDPCLASFSVKKKGLEDVSPDVLVVYTIILPDRLVLLLSSQSGMKMVVVAVESSTLKKEVMSFRRALERPAGFFAVARGPREEQIEKIRPSDYLDHARRLYNWIFRPIEKDLEKLRSGTIIFVPDGILRTIPVTAFHDGERYVIERYPVATTPSLSLTEPKPITGEKKDILMAGLSEGVQGFPALENVDAELDEIRAVYGGRMIKNRDFSFENLKKVFKETPYQIVHISTHGEFTKDINDSFLLTWDGKITMNDLDSLLRMSRYRKEAVELITLSACKTAAGDERAALGLAGIAVKAGARSALATLWSVSDQVASEVVVEFYRQIREEKATKAIALQKAQRKILETRRFRHPFYWSSFLLIGNWL